MKISTDLIDALLMLSVIILVLIGTTPFDNPTNKTILMSAFSVIAVVAAIMRVIKIKKGQKVFCDVKDDKFIFSSEEY